MSVIIENIVNYTTLATALTSPEGSVLLIYNNLRMIAGSGNTPQNLLIGKYSNLSLVDSATKVWVKIPIEITDPVDTMTFQYKFKEAAEGLLSVYFDDQLVYKADQRHKEPNVSNYSGNVAIDDISSGTHSLLFRLDAYNGMQSEIDISDVQIGKMIFAKNEKPIANAGVDQQGNVGKRSTLDGSSSNDPDNGPAALSFFWTQRSGPAVNLAESNSIFPSFLPIEPGNYIFSLVVNDGSENSDADDISVKVSDVPISVIYPNGDEKWKAGNAQIIRWYVSQALTNHKVPVSIWISKDAGRRWLPIGIDLKNQMSYTWTIDRNLVTNRALLKVCALSNQRRLAPVCDASDSTFVIDR